MKNLINFLVRCRKENALFSIQECAYHCKVSEMTVRNFENGNFVNVNVLCYYIACAVIKKPEYANEIVNYFKEAREDFINDRK